MSGGWTKEVGVSYFTGAIKALKQMKANGYEPYGGYEKRMAYAREQLKYYKALK